MALTSEIATLPGQRSVLLYTGVYGWSLSSMLTSHCADRMINIVNAYTVKWIGFLSRSSQMWS